MALLTKLGQGQGYAKVGLFGFPKSGKSYTSTDLAIGTYKFFGNCGDIVFVDTEGGAEYLSARIKDGIGKEGLVLKSRSFRDLMEVATKELKPNDILIVDSVTHIWRELCDSHLANINEALKRKNRPQRFKLEFQDWSVLKRVWEGWTSWYLNSPNHVFISGRAGYEYDFQTSEDVGGNERKELVKTGVRMKVESEFGFEPSLLIEMERLVERGSRRVTKRQATVIGDRFNVLDGKVFINPKFKDFEPHFRHLKPGALNQVDTELKSDTGVTDEDGNIEWNREKKTRTILAEEIIGLLTHHYPGQTARDKQTKGTLLFEAFGMRSWTAIENMDSSKLREGLSFLREKLDSDALQAVERPKMRASISLDQVKASDAENRGHDSVAGGQAEAEMEEMPA